VNTPKRSIQDPGRLSILVEKSELDQWRAAAKAEGVPLVQLIRRAMQAELQRLDRQRERD